jgi:hypothetical protein
MGQATHPEGPRTLAAMLRETAPLPADLAERLLRLDSGRHPTLGELRLALGLDLDLDGVQEAVRAAWSALVPTATDGELAVALDGMHRALRSTRLVRARCTAAGPQVTREGGPVCLREGERLVLLVFADNETGAHISFSAESHGEGIGGSVEPQRTGSALLDLGPMQRGSYLLPLLVVADGKPTTIDIPIECAPAGTLALRCVDDETGEPTAARVYLFDSAGAAWPVGVAFRRDQRGDAWFHVDGSCEAVVSGSVRLRVTRGIEYEACTEVLTMPPGGRIERTLRLRRWSNAAVEGWHSGDVHVHLHYGGEYLLQPADAALAQRAEDVGFMSMMVANQGSGWVHDAAQFTGRDHELSTPDHILCWGEEYRNDFYGHLCMYGIRELIPPVYSGFAASAHPHDLPANADAARRCREAGGTLSYAHPMMGAGDLDRVFAEKRSFEAKELPVDAALGLVDAVDIMAYPSDHRETARLWYRLLNCGLRLAATAGSDTFMNCCDWGAFSNPPAGVRAFVRVDGAFTTASWCAGVRAGRTFVTNGPMLRLTATPLPGVRGGDAAVYTLGDEVHARSGDTIHVVASARSRARMDRVELLVDGEVVQSVVSPEGVTEASIEGELRVERSCWLALRATGPSDPAVVDDACFAHTSPIYVTVDGRSRRNVADAAYFVEWIERLIDMTEREGRFPGDAARDEVLARFREGRAFFRALASA